jgi:type IV pilus assembly protein PilB
VPAGLVAPEDSPEERERVEALAREHGVPYLQLNGHEIDPDLFRLVPRDIARKLGAVPLKQVGHSLVVAMADPGDSLAIDDLKFLTGFDVEVVVASRRDLRESLDRADLAQSAVPVVELGVVCCDEEPEPDAFEGVAGKIIRLVLRDAHMKKEAQVQLELTDSDVVVRYGLEGNRRDFLRPPRSLRHELVRQLRHAVSTLPGQEGQLHFQTRGERISYEVRFNPTALGEEVILHRLSNATA